MISQRTICWVNLWWMYSLCCLINGATSCTERFQQTQPFNLSLFSSLHVLSIHFHLLSFAFIISPLLSSCLLFWSPLRRAVVSLQPPQSTSHSESWRRSKPIPLSCGWVTSSTAPQALLQVCGPKSWQLREAIVGEGEINHTWQLLCNTHILTYAEAHIP